VFPVALLVAVDERPPEYDPSELRVTLLLLEALPLAPLAAALAERLAEPSGLTVVVDRRAPAAPFAVRKAPPLAAVTEPSAF
jgi:hypothetical protein